MSDIALILLSFCSAPLKLQRFKQKEVIVQRKKNDWGKPLQDFL